MFVLQLYHKAMEEYSMSMVSFNKFKIFLAFKILNTSRHMVEFFFIFFYFSIFGKVIGVGSIVILITI